MRVDFQGDAGGVGDDDGAEGEGVGGDGCDDEAARGGGEDGAAAGEGVGGGARGGGDDDAVAGIGGHIVAVDEDLRAQQGGLFTAVDEDFVEGEVLSGQLAVGSWQLAVGSWQLTVEVEEGTLFDGEVALEEFLDKEAYVFFADGGEESQMAEVDAYDGWELRVFRWIIF